VTCIANKLYSFLSFSPDVGGTVAQYCWSRASYQSLF